MEDNEFLDRDSRDSFYDKICDRLEKKKDKDNIIVIGANFHD